MSNTTRQRSLAGCEAGQEEKDLDTGKACQGCHQLTNGQLQVLHLVPPSICSVQDVFLNTCVRRVRVCACVRARTRACIHSVHIYKFVYVQVGTHDMRRPDIDTGFLNHFPPDFFFYF